MRKLIFGILTFLVIVGAVSFAYYKISNSGVDYYVQILNDGRVTPDITDNDTVHYIYNYEKMAVDDDGDTKKIKFTADHNIKHNAYLKLTYNKKKGVTSWEKVEANEIPKTALNRLKALLNN